MQWVYNNMKQIIVKKSDGGVIIISPNTKKYGPVAETIYKEVDHVEEVNGIETITKIVQGAPITYEIDKVTKVPTKRRVIDRVIRPYTEEKALQKYIDPNNPEFVGEVHDYVIVDTKPSKVGLESRKQLYWELDGNGNTVIKQDLAWEKRLMPDQVIKKKHLDSLKARVETMLGADIVDPVELTRAQHEHTKIKDMKAGPQNENPFWINLALTNLDKRVAKGESDKPNVREKLLAKKQEMEK